MRKKWRYYIASCLICGLVGGTAALFKDFPVALGFLVGLAYFIGLITADLTNDR